MSTESPPTGVQVFLRPDSRGAGGIIMTLAGLGGIGVAAVGFAVAVSGRVGTLSLHGMSTLPALLGVGALTAGWRMLRSPRRVAVGPEGLAIETRRGVRRLGWDEVGCGAVETGGASHRRLLNVTDVRGKSVARLDESFDRFDEMVAAISRHVDAKGDDTAGRILRKKARRQAALAFGIGALLLSACAFVGWTTRENQRGARLLAEKGEPGLASVVRRFVAPNGVTKRVEYRTAGAGGRSATRNVEVTPAYWASLADARTVPVMVVPDEPGFSRLMSGEVEDYDFARTPAGGYAVSAAGGLLGLFLFAAAPFMWNGWDLAHDSKTQKWSVKRHGQVVWRSGGAR